MLGLVAGSFAHFIANEAIANPLDTFGFGSRAASMGSAVVADSSDFAAVYYNPAGLVGAKGPDFSVGYFHASHNLAMNGRDNHVDSVRGIVGGFVTPGKIAGIPFAFGLATHLPDERISRIRTMRQEQPRWELYDNRSQLLYLSTALAIRPFSFLEIGAGITHLAATRGRLEITGKADIVNPHDSQLRHEVMADLSTVRYPQAGMRVHLGDAFTLGLAYRARTRLELQLDTKLQGQVDALGLEIPASYSLSSRNVGVFIPRQMALGSSMKLWDRHLTVNLDVTWMGWSTYESAISRSTTELDVKVPEGIPVTIPPNPKPTQVIPPNFRDTFVPRLGIEYVGQVNESIEVPFRAGYVYERSPVPTQKGVTNFVDTDRHVLSLGTGVRLLRPIAELPGDLRLDLHAQYSLLPERVMLKDDPTDFTGDYRAGGNILSAGATLGLGFP